MVEWGSLKVKMVQRLTMQDGLEGQTGEVDWIITDPVIIGWKEEVE